MGLMSGVTVLAFQGKTPQLAADVLVAAGARLIGDVTIGAGSSVWFNTVLRADVNYIRVGERTNIQDNTTVHVASGGAPTIIGNDVTIGHNAVVHACQVDDLCLIGMGAVLLDGCQVGRECLVGAGSLLTAGKVFPPRSLILGSPAKVLRTLTDQELAHLKESAARYLRVVSAYAL